MNTTKLTMVSVMVALATSACTHTVVRTRVVPVYESRLVQVGGMVRASHAYADAAAEPASAHAQQRPPQPVTPVFVRRRIQVGTVTETYKVKKLSWKRTTVGVLIAPVTLVTYLVAGLG